MSESSSDTNGSGFEVIADLSEQDDKEFPMKDNFKQSNKGDEHGRSVGNDDDDTGDDKKQEANVVQLERQKVDPPINPSPPTTIKESRSLDLSKVTGQLEDVKIAAVGGGQGISGQEDDQEAGSPKSPSLLGWFAQNNFINKVKEKAKNSVDTMITTLDPGMKEYLYSGGDINVIVASEKDSKVSAVREAFQDAFGRATVKGIPSQCDSIAKQPLGFEAGKKGAFERISSLRAQHTSVPQNQVIVAIENFIVELLPESWFDIGYLVLEDPLSGIKLEVYTQATPIPSVCVNQLKFETPSDYPSKSTGFAVTLGQAMGQHLNVSPEDWHQAWIGINRKELIYKAAFALANLYKSRLNR